MNTNPKLHVTNPAVSVNCLRALAALMEKDRSKRIGAAGFEKFTHHPFFARIDFDALEQKLIDPIFVPSSEKTNFDATYDLEELLLEEAPLEARARRQKPRAELKEDATAKEIREDELHRIIETMFEPFDYTTVSFDGLVKSKLALEKGTGTDICFSNAAAAIAASWYALLSSESPCPPPALSKICE
jgi:serine/threonine kinase 32